MQPKPKSLVVITGASSGIGEAIAKLFSEAGFPLLLAARRIERLRSLNLPNALCEEVDVRDVAQFQKALDKAVQQFGEVDCLINNAGVMLLGDPQTQNPDELKTMLDVNVLGVLNGIHCVLNSMIQRKHGTIINISSIAGRKTFTFHAGYCASKFAVHALSESIRADVAKHNVRVSTIAPGVVETDLLSHTSSEDIIKAYTDWKSTLNYVLRPEDVAQAALYLYTQPQQVCIRELVITATAQET
ncbi:SDR family oxidoreductase [Legionella micdadei]|uniref:Estradiol 17-beta-dehydrogenase n=1 Tax=Legionella micdadei TaxID=451 RepID=A0A098GD96_LEGMI|nr:SDR family oxidoreductase [Legionella micdadei]ARG98337.1 oxidoreductase [Legionella micdadei]ARH01089.1 oxidoreductase [Legionella micdadei]KTD27268.1 Estradiol 17-beta-dehydrogenase [Legionella micdadei]NSL18654.1 SDR family oxidoreductase [Legionella micdadei]CEG59990.1 Estradiol 17-beta-dehydrogenase [Legionella micdadei]